MPLYITPCDVCHESTQFDLETGWVHVATGKRECADSRLSTRKETP